jgi:mono/diheme cytochrome c family protein
MVGHRAVWAVVSLWALGWGVAWSAGMPGNVAGVVESRCAGCHGGGNPEAGVRLDGVWSAERLVSPEGDTWFRALGEIESGRMPPEDSEQPTAGERTAVADWIRGELAALQKQQRLSVGRSQLRRLAREEYANTIFDIFGFRPPVSVDLPEDGRVDGYQKVAKALPLSAASVDGYMRLTDRIMGRLLKPVPAEPPAFQRCKAKPSEQSAGHLLELDPETVVSFNSDIHSGPLDFKGCGAPGLHKIRLSVYGFQTDKPLPFGIYAGHVWAYPQIIELLTILDAPPGKPAVLEAEIYLSSSDINDKASVGDGIRLVPFGLGVPVPKNTQAKAAADKGKPGLAVQWIEVQPMNVPPIGDRWLTADFSPECIQELRNIREARRHGNPPVPVAKLKTVKPDEFVAIMEKTLRRVVPRFLRRDPSPEEFGSLMAAVRADVEADRPAEDVLLDRVRELLTSPDFFCIVEDPGPLSDFALATRLSYFLWNSGPDEQLLEVARAGRLHDPVVLREQTDRMLADPRSQRFYKGLAEQWLRLSAIDDTTPDGRLFPEYHLPENDLLKWSSVAETEAFLKLLVDENASVRELVDSRRVLANAVLARHYGLEGVEGGGLREVALPAGSPFGGLWTQPAVLKVTANGTNTSPVKRGVFVAERLLGVHIPPPPPNIEPISTDTSSATTLREKLALHAGGGSCAACHAKFDGYGFALESFDPAGMHRERYRTTAAELVTWNGPASGTWGDQAGGVSTDWNGGTVPGAFDPVVISGTQSGTITYDRPLYADAGLALHGLAIGNATAGEVTTLVTSADMAFRAANQHEYKQVVVGPGGHWLHRSGTVAINDNVLVDGGELGVTGGTFKAGLWPAWTPLEISRGGRIVITGGAFGAAAGFAPHLIGNVGSGSLEAGGASTIAIAGGVRIGTGRAGRGEVVLDTSEPTGSVRQWDVQHGRLVIGKKSGRVFCVTGQAKEGTYRIGMAGAPAVLDKLGDAELGADPHQDGKIFLEVGPTGTVNWHGGGLLTNRQNDTAVITNAGVFNYLDDGRSNVFHFGGPAFVNAAGGRFHWRGAAGIDLRNSRNEGSSSLRNAGLLATGHDGQVTLLGDLALEKTGTLRVGLGAEEKTGIAVGGKEGGAITLDGRLEIAPLGGGGAGKLGGRTFTILARAPGGPPITGEFATKSDDIAKIEYSADTVKITLVENPQAQPAAEPPAAAEPATFAAPPRLAAAGLAALQKRGAGWIRDRPTWRHHLPVEANGLLPDGQEFAGIAELRERLAAAPAQLAYGVGSHLVTYATGTRPLGSDMLAVEAIVGQAEADGYGFRSLLHAVIQSDLFRSK